MIQIEYDATRTNAKKDVYFVISQNKDENKTAIVLSELNLCGVGLYDPDILDIEKEYFDGKLTPLVIYTDNEEVKEHVKTFAKVVNKDEYEDECVKTSYY